MSVTSKQPSRESLPLSSSNGKGPQPDPTSSAPQAQGNKEPSAEEVAQNLANNDDFIKKTVKISSVALFHLI